MTTALSRYAFLCSCVLGGLTACSGTTGDTDRQASVEDCRVSYQHLAALRVKSVEKNSALSDAELAKHRANFATHSEDELKACAENRSLAWAQCVQALSSISDSRECED